MQKTARSFATFAALIIGASALIVACTDTLPTDISTREPNTERALLSLKCTASIAARTVSCGGLSLPSGLKAEIVGDQNVNVKLTSSNVSYNSGTHIFEFDVTVQNLMNEAIGTYGDGVPDPEGIQVFFNSGPTVTGGTGVVTALNATGNSAFTGGNQPYFTYNEILSKNQVSSAKTWQLDVPSTVSAFDFTLLLETETQRNLVINEVFVNPGGTITDALGEWFEIYNAGSRPVDLQNLVIADSAASGRRPYHLISSSVVIQPGGYAVLGNTANTTSNGGVPVDYAYGAALQLANSLDAVKIARVAGTDTVTIDRTQYASAAVSAQNGISRELKNPALDNGNMDGSNWADASVTSVYGPGGRGTPKAPNSTFTPNIGLDGPTLPVPMRANRPLLH
jgi:hypothetical protein